MFRHKKRTALVLGSGGARGWSHIGVIKALDEAGFRPDIIVGTSMGALVGGVYASGRLSDLEQLALEFGTRELLYYFMEMKIPRSGLIDGEKIVRLVRRHVAAETIESLPIPFAAVATDILTGEEVVLGKGDAINAIRASISIPGIFTPVEGDGHVLVDGGLVNPIPVSVARSMGASRVVAVDISHGLLQSEPPASHRTKPLSGANREEGRRTRLLRAIERRVESFNPGDWSSLAAWFSRSRGPNVFDVLGNTIRIIESQVAQVRLKSEPPDVLIRPKVGGIGMLDFHHARDAIAAGYEAGRAALDQIRR